MSEFTSPQTVTLSISPSSVSEDGTANMAYTFTRSGVTTNALTVNYTVGGTATFSTDYTQTGAATFTSTTGTVTFAANSTTAKVTIDPTADTIVENNETVALTLAAGTGYTVGTTTAVTGTIISEETPPSFTITNPNTITIPDSGASTPYPSTINVSGLSGTINSLKVTLTNINHTYPDDIDILLVGPTGAKSLLMSDVGGGSDLNNLTLTFDPTAANFLPDNNQITSGSYKPTDFETGDSFNSPAPGGTYGVDFSGFNNTNPNGVWSLYVMDDAGGDSGSITGGWSLTIGIDSALPSITLSISPSSVSEDGTANMAYTFTRSGVTTNALTVNYTVGGTATFSTDYTQSGAATFTSTTGTVTFAANATTAKVTIDPTADTIVESNETVALTLAAGTGYTVGTTTAVTGTINNDDVAFTIAAASSSRTEGNSGSKAFTFTVTRSGNTTGTNNITWAVTGTGTNPANAADFVGGLLPSGTVSFAPGETSKVITVNVQGDTTVEPNENFTVTLSNPTNGATLGTPSTATVTIVDDDGSVPFLVDIRPGAFSSYPKNLTAVGSTLYFIADDDVNGYELWKSDGTVAGTVAVADIRSPYSLTAMGNTLFFTARDGLNGQELWKSNGTAAGTVLVKDIFPGSSSSNPSRLTAVGSTLFFNANDGVNGFELWKSDGTAAGTVLVKDIWPGGGVPWGSSNPDNLTAVGNTLFFTPTENNFDDELWKSDGTAAGTVLVKDIRPGGLRSEPRNLTAVGSTLYFTADDGVNGTELWKSDGTAAGTVLVKDILPGAFSSYPGNLTAVGSTLFFTAGDGVNGTELWKSDGTAAGTVLVRDIRPGSYGSYSYSSSPRYLTAVGSTLYFTANDGLNGFELWKSDGTAAGTVLVADIIPGASSSNPGNLTAVGSTLYFTANDNVNGNELWKSDGTAAGTVLAADIIPGASGYGPSSLKVVGNTLFFTANNGVNGQELWALNVGGPTVPTLAIAATNANQTEGNSGSKAFTFTVTRAVNTTGSNNVSWAVTGSGSNPANATDFVGGLLPSGVVSFAPGESSKVITVNVQGDTTVEPDENFTVTLSNATNGATITTATAIGTIQNDDAAVPTLAIAATSASQTEGNSGSKAFTFTVTRAVNTTGTNNVSWAVTGTGTNPANATDFVGSVLPSGTVSFAAGETSKVITVNVQGDTTVEPNENFTVTLSNATNGATITTATATGTIENDDAA
nr:hypothetical protein [Microcystis aeruginosa K13-05]